MEDFWGLLIVGIFAVLFGLGLVLARRKVAETMSGLQESSKTWGARTTPGIVLFGGFGFMAIGTLGIVGALFFPEAF